MVCLLYSSAKEIFSRKQQPTETVDDFIAQMQKAARIIDADEKTTIYATLNGLRPELVGYVTQQKPDTMIIIIIIIIIIINLLEAARVAELTNPTTSDTTGNAVSSQLTEVWNEMKKMNARWKT